MRLFSLIAMSLMLSLALVMEANAADRKKARKSAARDTAAAPQPRPDRYRELLADRMPIGSTEWWEQMRREGRLGGETP
jgi:hypothetical protein